MSAKRGSKNEIEHGTAFAPQFGEDSLIPCITACAETGHVLMFAYMNEEALQKTIETKQAHYWSRSRGALWHKGGKSGLVQNLVELRVDCDQDCLLLLVDMPGIPATGGRAASCHAGYQNCFYRSVTLDQSFKLFFNSTEKVFETKDVYSE